MYSLPLLLQFEQGFEVLSETARKVTGKTLTEQGRGEDDKSSSKFRRLSSTLYR